MLKKRLIATLLVSNFNVVQTKCFKTRNFVGNIFTAIDFFNGWAVDELMILRITREGEHDRFCELVQELSRRCFVPLSVGGDVNDPKVVDAIFRSGADKVVLNTVCVEAPGFITEVASRYGNQAVIVSMDGVPNDTLPSGYELYTRGCKQATGIDALAHLQQVESLGAGELLVNSHQHDGAKGGYDIELLKKIKSHAHIPVIAMGGVGEWQHMVDAIDQADVDAVAAGNIFHYTEHSTRQAKEFLLAHGAPVRYAGFYRVPLPRLPKNTGF